MPGGRVAVVGSLNMDLVARVPRAPRLGETILAESFGTYPGGKGLNQAVAARRAGAKVSMLGRVGEDPFGAALVACLEEEGIDGGQVQAVAEGTGVAVIHVLPDGRNTIAVAAQANGTLGPEHVDAARRMLEASDVLLLQGEVPLAASLRAAEVARAAGRLVLFNPAPVPPPGPELERLLQLSQLVVPNESELETLSGRRDMDGLSELGARSGGSVVVTLGARGAALWAPGTPVRQWPTHTVQVLDTTAAGDAFCGAMAACLAAGGQTREAVAWGLAAGGLAGTGAGALPSLPRRTEILGLLQDL